MESEKKIYPRSKIALAYLMYKGGNSINMVARITELSPSYIDNISKKNVAVALTDSLDKLLTDQKAVNLVNELLAD
jgi:hypothetical protein